MVAKGGAFAPRSVLFSLELRNSIWGLKKSPILLIRAAGSRTGKARVGTVLVSQRTGQPGVTVWPTARTAEPHIGLRLLLTTWGPSFYPRQGQPHKAATPLFKVILKKKKVNNRGHCKAERESQPPYALPPNNGRTPEGAAWQTTERRGAGKQRAGSAAAAAQPLSKPAELGTGRLQELSLRKNRSARRYRRAEKKGRRAARPGGGNSPPTPVAAAAPALPAVDSASLGNGSNVRRRPRGTARSAPLRREARQPRSSPEGRRRCLLTLCTLYYKSCADRLIIKLRSVRRAFPGQKEGQVTSVW